MCLRQISQHIFFSICRLVCPQRIRSMEHGKSLTLVGFWQLANVVLITLAASVINFWQQTESVNMRLFRLQFSITGKIKYNL